MKEGKVNEQKNRIELEYELNEPPLKVWRAISIPEYRENWLPRETLVDPEATSIIPGQEIRYRLRENTPPFLESVVTLIIVPNSTGGTNLQIIHELTDVRFDGMMKAAANSNISPLMATA